jgi:hypothetical protein
VIAGVRLLVAGCLLLLAAAPACLAALPARPYWLGPSYDGLRLSATLERTYVYGTCEAGPDSGCAPPYEVQHHASCARNPLSLDIPPRRVFSIRGGAVAAAYGSMIDVGIGRHTVTVFARNGARALRAARRLRGRGQAAPPRRLPAPVYPKTVLREIKRAQVAYARLGSTAAVAERTGLAPAQARTRIRMATLLGPGVLRGVKPPSRPWPVVERERQIALNAIALGRKRTLERYGLTLAELRRLRARVRGLSGSC